jgi:hypothetical protein
MTRILFGVVCYQLLCIHTPGAAQEATGTRTFISRDNLTRYYKAAVNANFLSDENGEYKFSASWFGLQRIFNDKLNIDTLYLSNANRKKRNVNIDLKLVPGEKSWVKSFSPSVSYAFVNNRDATERNKEDYKEVDDFGAEMTRALERTITQYQQETNSLADENEKRRRNEIEKKFKTQWNTDTVTISDMDPGIRKIFEEKIRSLKEKYKDILDGAVNLGVYDRLWAEAKDRISRRGLAKALVGSKFENQGIGQFSTSITYLRGLNRKAVSASPWDLETKASFVMERDTASMEESTDLERSKLLFEGGINKVLWRRGEKKGKGEESILEMKIGADFSHITSGLNEEEKENIFKSGYHRKAYERPLLSCDTFIRSRGCQLCWGFQA